MLRRAQLADPSFFPAHLEQLRILTYRTSERAALLKQLKRNSDLQAQCLAVVAGSPFQYPAAAIDGLRAVERLGATACTSTMIALTLPELTPARFWSDTVIAAAKRALAHYPELGDLWRVASSALETAGRPAEAIALLERALTQQRHATHRVMLYYRLTELLEKANDPKGSELRRAVAAAVERDGRPGMRFLYPDYVRFRETLAAEPVWLRQAQERLRVAQQARNSETEWVAARQLGSTLSDAGRPAEALPYVERAVAIADSGGRPLLQLEAFRFRGRVYAKLGRLHDAEHDLRRAIAIGRSLREPYLLAEAYHNLAHVWEGSGQLERAASAIDHFVALTRPLTHAQPRMMSLRDAGLIRWKAGWPAAANAAFAEMARVIDEQERHHYWAGEYYERSGELSRALHYYRLGRAHDPGEASLNLGGLARMFEALGMPDSAEAAAREHDQLLSNQLDVPLLPPMLARRGRADDALRISRAWSARQLERGNVQGAATAALSLSELLLHTGATDAALTQAMAAESLAVRLNLTDERVRAERLQGLARLRTGESARALALLRRAQARAEAHPTAETLLLTRQALGDALAEAGAFTDALAAYERAAQAVDRITALLDVDLDRVRYQERQLAPFNAALNLLLAAREPRVDDVAVWLQRRKAAALALAVMETTVPHTATAPLALSELQRRLPAAAALIDYVVLDSAAFALVVRARGTRLVALPASPDSMQQLATLLTRGFSTTLAGRVDLARAPFSLAAGRALFDILLRPLQPHLDGVDRLHIVPDGALHALPFDALVERLPAAGSSDYLHATYAVDRYQIELLPAAQFLPRDVAQPRSLSGPHTRVLLISRDVPGGAREQSAIRDAWRTAQLHVLSDDAATESAWRERGGAYDIVHFAVHARADDRDPALSHLRLAADSAHDGFLHVSEVAAARQQARLVVLSACETHAGQAFRGEGLMGLARAFLVRGAQAVVGTRWPVGPATAGLMASFHQGLAAGAAPAPALREARLALRRDPATAHPFFWSAFVLVEGGTHATGR